MALVIKVKDGEKVLVVTRCGDVAELAIRKGDHGVISLIMDGPDEITFKRGAIAGELVAEPIEQRIARMFHLSGVQVMAVDFDAGTFEVEHEPTTERPDGVSWIDRRDLWPCEATGKRCANACPTGKCYQMARGRRA